MTLLSQFFNAVKICKIVFEYSLISSQNVFYSCFCVLRTIGSKSRVCWQNKNHYKFIVSNIFHISKYLDSLCFSSIERSAMVSGH